MTFIAGPENPDFVPYAEISPYLVNSIMTTEDSGFMKHHGFIPSEFRSALQQNLQRGYFRLGASSITMQMVKNVLLSREKTLSRKLQEMFLTWYLEHHLTKERILEIYFNVIEFGPGIYGIGRAAKHYFGHPAKELTPRESAFFSSILPNPKRRYVQFCHQNGQVDAKWDNYLKRILRRMHERGRLTDAEFNDAVAQPLTFSRAEATSEKECMAVVKRLTGGPPWPSAK
jgi:membrane peptidoglycan carboxypeptidase